MKNFKIIFEDNDFLIIDKEAGLQVHPDGKNNFLTLTDYLQKDFKIKGVGEDENRPGVVHRLDRDTSGLMMIVLNNKAFDYYKELFRKRKIKKTYHALVHGLVKKTQGRIELPIGIHPKKIGIRTIQKFAKNIKEAVSEYKVLKNFKLAKSKSRVFDYSLLEVNLKTGRTHQIRVHLKSIGYPIVGDKVYKFKRLTVPENFKGMFLVSKRLEFEDRKGVLREYEIDYPKEMKLCLEAIK